MDKRQAEIEKLKAVHSFPGPYTFRIIGLNQPGYEASVLEALSHLELQKLGEKYSENKKHLSLTLQIIAEKPEVVLDTYALLAKLPAIKYIL